MARSAVDGGREVCQDRRRVPTATEPHAAMADPAYRFRLSLARKEETYQLSDTALLRSGGARARGPLQRDPLHPRLRLARPAHAGRTGGPGLRALRHPRGPRPTDRAVQQPLRRVRQVRGPHPHLPSLRRRPRCARRRGQSRDRLPRRHAPGLVVVLDPDPRGGGDRCTAGGAAHRHEPGQPRPHLPAARAGDAAAARAALQPGLLCAHGPAQPAAAVRSAPPGADSARLLEELRG